MPFTPAEAQLALELERKRIEAERKRILAKIFPPDPTSLSCDDLAALRHQMAALNAKYQTIRALERDLENALFWVEAQEKLAFQAQCGKNALAKQECTELKEKRVKPDVFLAGLLAGKRVKAETVLKQADDVGYSQRTIERVKKKLGVLSERDGFGPGAVWYWRLPVEH